MGITPAKRSPEAFPLIMPANRATAPVSSNHEPAVKKFRIANDKRNGTRSQTVGMTNTSMFIKSEPRDEMPRLNPGDPPVKPGKAEAPGSQGSGKSGIFTTERQWRKAMFEKLKCSDKCRLYLRHELNRLSQSTTWKRLGSEFAKISATEAEVKRVVALFEDPEFEAGTNMEDLVKKTSKKRGVPAVVRNDLDEEKLELEVTAKVHNLSSPLGMMGTWFKAAIAAHERGETVKSINAMTAIEQQRPKRSKSTPVQIRDRPNEHLKNLSELRRNSMRAKLELFLLASVDLANATAAEKRMPEFAPFAAKIIERQAYKYSHSLNSYNYKIKFLCDGIEQGKRYVVMRDGAEEMEIMWQKKIVEVLQTPEFEGEDQIPIKKNKGRK